MRKLWYAFLLFAPVWVGLAACSEKKAEFGTCQGMIWNTSFHITFKGAESFDDSVYKVLRSVERSVSVFDSSSLVSRINRNETDSIDAIFETVFLNSLKVNKESEGYFDPTLAPLISAYGFGEGRKRELSAAELDSMRSLVGIERVKIQQGRIVKPSPGTSFNFSAIAKGYGCDRVGEMFRSNGIADYLVEIGGEIAAAGSPAHGGKWNVSVDKPIFSESELHESMVVIGITDCGVATSGNYRNFRKESGKTIGHTIDPTTGLPSESDMLSATIVASNCMLADAYATACMAMGSAKAKKMINRLNLAAMLVTSDGRVWESRQFKQLIIETR